MPFGDHVANIQWANDTNPGGPTWIWPDYHFGPVRRQGMAKGMDVWADVCDAAAQGLPTFNALCTVHWPAFWGELTVGERETAWVACKRIARIA
jgi:hypothetical protein